MHKENRLLELFRRLPEKEADSLLDFAEFLASRYPMVKAEAVSVSQPEQEKQKIEPAVVPRPEGESVIAAVKRLSTTYHMLSKDKMLHETADLVSQSLMGGCDTVEVIDELETIFLKMYEKHMEDKSN